MTIQTDNNNETATTALLTQITAVFTANPQALKEIQTDLPFIQVIWDDDGLTGAETAAINSGLAVLGLN